MDPTHTTRSEPARPRGSRLKRWALAAVGVVCVGLGALGVFVPGLPTTIFLIAASACFVRSCPWLEEKMLHNRLFRPYLRYLDGSAVMPMRARVVALVMMWSCIAVSSGLMLARLDAGPWIAGILVVAGGVGSVFIWAWRCEPRCVARQSRIQHM